MAAQNFRVRKNGPVITSFDVPLNVPVTLYCGDDMEGNKPEVALAPAASTTAVSLTPDMSKLVSAASTVFSVTGKTANTSVALQASVTRKGVKAKFCDDLTINVCGTPKKFAGYEVDMLYNLASSGDATKLYGYSLILGLDSYIDSKGVLIQNTQQGHYNCGDVAMGYGLRYFGKPASTDYNTRYYKRPTKATGNLMQDLKFDAAIVKSAIAKIKQLVLDGTPVRLWVLDSDGYAPDIQQDTGTHFITVIGYSATRLLFLDPWPNGSVTTYDGGMYAARPHYFMGELVFDPLNLAAGIHSVAGITDTKTTPMNYRVIAGPK